MSTQPALPLSHVPRAAPGASSRARVSIAGLSLTGVLLFLSALLVVGSGYMSYRPVLFGLAVHPYLFPVAAAFPFAVLARIGVFPARVLTALLVFVAMYCFSVLSGRGLPMNDMIKVLAALFTIITFALLVRRRGDFVAGVLGLNLAIAVLAWVALRQEPGHELEVMEGANKNSYSLFALPALLLGGFICTRMKSVPAIIKGLLTACALPALVAIFMSANRSGYLGAALVGLLLFWDRRGRGLLLVAVVAAGVVFWISNYGDTSTFDTRVEQTVEGTKSDTLRMALLRTCFLVALENPIIGVSPSELPWELGRRVKIPGTVQLVRFDPHNVFGHVAGGSGLVCFAALLAVGWALVSWKPRGGPLSGKDNPFYAPRRLLRMLVILWVVRGMFTAEILYNPSFNMALGLTIGLCALAEAERQGSTAASRSLARRTVAA